MPFGHFLTIAFQENVSHNRFSINSHTMEETFAVLQQILAALSKLERALPCIALPAMFIQKYDGSLNEEKS